MPETSRQDPHSVKHHPNELRYVSARKVLVITFDDGAQFQLPAEYLRVESPSAEIQGHGPGQKTILGGRRHVTITGMEPVGSYAVRIKFDDQHDSGLYTWDYLYTLGKDQKRIWSEYLKALEDKGLKR